MIRMSGRKALLSAGIAGTVFLAGSDYAAGASPGMVARALAPVAAAAFTGPPAQPAAFKMPSTPLAAATSVGYLPESWNVTPNGTFEYSIPIDVPDGRAGMQPHLALSYSSNMGNGMLGTGFSMSGFSSITRCGKALAIPTEGVTDGVDNADSGDDHYCLDGRKLVAISGTYGALDSEYRTEQDAFTRIRITELSSSRPSKFTLWDRDGRIRTYVAAVSEQLAATGTATSRVGVNVPTVWLLDVEQDRAGNSVYYRYTTWNVAIPSGGPFAGFEYVPYRILYGNSDGSTATRYVQFNFESRPDPSFSWQRGIRHELTQRLTSVAMYGPNPSSTGKLWQYDFTYEPSVSPMSGRSRLASVKRSGWLPGGSAPAGSTWSKQFSWADTVAEPRFNDQTRGGSDEAFQFSGAVPAFAMVLDANGDGSDDLLYNRGGTNAAGQSTAFRGGARFGSNQSLNTYYSQTSGADLSDDGLAATRAIDLQGDGSAEIWVHQVGATCRQIGLQWDNVNHRFNDTSVLADEACPATGSNKRYLTNFGDINGDGLADMIASGISWNEDASGNVSNLFYGPWRIRLNLGGGLGFDSTLYTPRLDGAVITTGCRSLITDPEGNGRVAVITSSRSSTGSGGNCPDNAVALLMDDAGTIKAVSAGADTTGLNNQFPSIEDNSLFGDFNGDGLNDQLKLTWSGTSAMAKLYWNTGNGYLADDTHPISVNRDNKNYTDQGVRIVDLNGDGRADIVNLRKASGFNEIQVDLSKGDGTFTHINYLRTPSGATVEPGTPMACTAQIRTPAVCGWTTSKVGDFNGDGFLDIARVVAGRWRVAEQVPHYGDRVVKVFDSANAQKWEREAIEYSSVWDEGRGRGLIASYPMKPVRSAMTVVKRVTSKAAYVNGDSSLAAGYSLEYSYARPAMDLRGRGFLGFGTFRIWDPQRLAETTYVYGNYRAATNDTYSYATYYPSSGLPDSVTSVMPIVSDATRGTLMTQCRQGATGASLPAACTRSARVTQTTNSYSLRQTNSGRTYVVQPGDSHTSTWEQNVSIDLGGPSGAAYNDLHGDLARLWGSISEPATVLVRTDTTGTTYDDYGNLTAQTTQTSDGTAAGRKLGVKSEFTATFDTSASRIADWLIDIPQGRTTTVTEADGTVQWRKQSWGADTLGQLTRIDIENPGPNVHERTDIVYDNTAPATGYGLPVKITRKAEGASDRVSHIEYGRYCGNPSRDGATGAITCPAASLAPDERIYASQVWSEHVDTQTDTPCNVSIDCRPTQWTAVHPGYGLAMAGMDINGVQTVQRYDALRRPIQSDTYQSNWAIEPTLTISYGPRPDGGCGATAGCYNGVVATVSRGGNTRTTAVDAMGRMLKTTLLAFDGSTTARVVEFDALGRVKRESRPYTDTGSTAPSQWTTYQFDNADRLAQTSHADGTGTSVGYPNFFETRTYDALSNESYVRRDLDGRIVTSASVLNGVDVKTSYAYAPFDLIKSVTDDKGNVTSMQYDVRGRRTQISDPDQGTVTTTFNGFGETTQSVKVGIGALLSQTASATLDDLGRVLTTTLTSSPAQAGIDGTTRFVWDRATDGTAGHYYGRGKVASSTSIDGITQTLRYDYVGRIGGFDYKDDAGDVYSVDFSYYNSADSSTLAGLLKTVSYPDAPGRTRFAVQRHYNAYGYFDQVQDVTSPSTPVTLWNVKSRDSSLALTGATIGNVDLDLSYYPLNGRPYTLKAKTGEATPTTLLDFEYAYKDNGLVLSRKDRTTARTENYDYDALSRLISWQLLNGSAPAVEHTYKYDTIGNLTEVWKKVGSATSARIESSSYGTGGTQPHALVLRQPYDPATGAALAADKYNYDGLGRQTSGLGPSANGRTLAYTGFDLPHSLTKAGSTWTFGYDAAGQRIKKSGADGTIVYVPGLYERRKLGGTTTHVFHVQGSDGPVAQLTYVQGGSSKVEYLLHDALGSTSTSFTPDAGDSTGKRVVQGARFFTDPWGKRIAADGTATTVDPTVQSIHTGFTGQEMDDSYGLINFRGRMYDPNTRRFLSADPLVANHLFGQAWNRYSYVFNSPTNGTDPSGFLPPWDPRIDRDGDGVPDSAYPESSPEGCLGSACFYYSGSYRDAVAEDAVKHGGSPDAGFEDEPGGHRFRYDSHESLDESDPDYWKIQVVGVVAQNTADESTGPRTDAGGGAQSGLTVWVFGSKEAESRYLKRMHEMELRGFYRESMARSDRDTSISDAANDYVRENNRRIAIAESVETGLTVIRDAAVLTELALIGAQAGIVLGEASVGLEAGITRAAQALPRLGVAIISAGKAVFSGPTDRNQVAGVVEYLQKVQPGSPIYIGTGTHGTASGLYSAAAGSLGQSRFFAEDLATSYRSLGGSVYVYDLSTPFGRAMFDAVVQDSANWGPGQGTIICAWCYSAASVFGQP